MDPGRLLQQELDKYPSLSRREWYRQIYLSSDHWKALRAEALKNHGRKCGACHKPSLWLDVHHLNYREIFNVQVSDLQLLCRPCHDKEHCNPRAIFGNNAKSRVFKALKMPTHIMIQIRSHLPARKASAGELNCAINQTIEELKQLGKITPELLNLLKASKTGKGARQKQHKLLGRAIK